MSPTRRAFVARLGGAGGVLAASSLGGCAASTSPAPPNVRVGSKPFPEQQILGYLAYERLRTVDGIQVVDEIGYGNSSENWRATANGVKDLYWEYTGTAWSRLPPRRSRRVTDPAQLFELVEADARDRGVRMARPAPFSNEYVLIADREWSDRTGLTTIDDVATHVDDGNTDFDIAFNEDFYHRADGWNGLLDHYSVGGGARERLDGRIVVTSVGLTYELLADGSVQLGSGFATDPHLDRQSLVVLEDDRDYFLPYQPAPTAYAPTVEANPAIFQTLAPVASSLDETTMRELNRQVIVTEREPREVARAYLDRFGDGS